jgi:putative ABC transport system permease protein
MLVLENILLAFKSIRANWLRSLITSLIIAFGIMALVGILTAIDSILGSMSNSFSSLGANSFTIYRSGERLGGRRGGVVQKLSPAITFQEASSFKKRFDRQGKVSLNTRADQFATLRYENKKSNPNVVINGIDENYLEANGYDLALGRNFTALECESATFRTIVGKDIVDILFDGRPEKAINELIYIKAQPYRIVGILKSKGSSFNQSSDRVALIPIQVARQQFKSGEFNFPITVFVPFVDQMEGVVDYSIGLMRTIRKIGPGKDNDFEIRKSDSVLGILKDNTATIRIATVAIALITLLGAAIGLMNIMLVSVTERTKEIGLLKAIGATKRHITLQFLTETLVLCQMGGVLGILFGILAGNGVSFFTGGAFIIPWAWIVLGFVTCLIIGLASGIYPAMKAAQMDPIEALRHD